MNRESAERADGSSSPGSSAARSSGEGDSLVAPQWRQCPITLRWVSIARGRAHRPHDYRSNTQRRSGAFCPFCAGNEEHTPAEVLAVRDSSTAPNASGWRVRSIANKYPAAVRSLDPLPIDEGPFSGLTGFGVHEVIVESPEHVTTTGELGVGQLTDVLWLYRQRLRSLREDHRLRYGLIFKNLGESSGASLEHLHSQLLATPALPAIVEEELNHTRQYFRRLGRCVFCDVIEGELSRGDRLAAVDHDWVAFCPYASRFPWETWILPRRHGSDFHLLADKALPSLAAFVSGVLARIERTLPILAYNYFLHTSPFDTFGLEYYHWHLEILPRVTNVAGFEWGSGFAINTLAPEDAAATLRQVDLSPADGASADMASPPVQQTAQD